MKIMVSGFSFILVLIMCNVFTSVSYGIEIDPVKERIEDTIKIGESNPGKKIFNTEFVKPAIFGNWPEYGGLVLDEKAKDRTTHTRDEVDHMHLEVVADV